MGTEMKPSVLTGELWMYVAFGIAAVWMKSHDIDIRELKRQGSELVETMGGWDTISIMAPAIIFGTKRMLLKGWQAYLDMKTSVAAIQNNQETKLSK